MATIGTLGPMRSDRVAVALPDTRYRLGARGRLGSTLVADLTATAETWRVRSRMPNTRRQTNHDADSVLGSKMAGDANACDE
ncbi:hypothetical protein CLCR_04474 [Cladophialophora carrionii]|uniref:Uncharacterized protein n=1 Tax=Cladophialophora carrionii TaxID=86049 RepID=A0A1C1CIT6_9EURO|nr:hypothetical protein CLCR_04474 [Cladophialophora carrionii]